MSKVRNGSMGIICVLMNSANCQLSRMYCGESPMMLDSTGDINLLSLYVGDCIVDTTGLIGLPTLTIRHENRSVSVSDKGRFVGILLSNVLNTYFENDAVDLTTNTSRQSPYTLRNEFVNRKISFEDRANTANQFGPMALNRNNSLAPASKEEKLIRKDSLKENIDKITQLQSKLMSAHLSESEKNIANLCRELNVKNDISDKHEDGDLSTSVHLSSDTNESELIKHNEFERDVETSGSQIVVAEISETTITPIGSRFALMEIKSLFYYLLKNFSIEKCDKTQHPLKLKANTSNVEAETGFWIQLRKRN